MPATRVGVDKTVSEADAAHYDGLLLPGGFINPDLLRQSAEARQFVREFANVHKPIVTLCHGPWVPGVSGTARRAHTHVVARHPRRSGNSGATWLDRDVVKDGNLLTSRGPQDMTSFVPAIIDHFAAAAPQSPPPPPRRPIRNWTHPSAGPSLPCAGRRSRPYPARLAGLMAGARMSTKTPLRKVFS